MTPERESLQTSVDAVLGGRLHLRQPLRGHRVGHDAILLAAATGARAGEHAVDLGAGIGSAGLALANRIDALTVSLVEIDPALAALAAENASLNDLAARVKALAADVEDETALSARGLTSGSADRVLMNPPFNDPQRQNVSPDARRRLAHVAGPGLLTRWIATAAWLLKEQGTLTLIWRAEGRAEVLETLTPALGAVAMLPVYPSADKPAIRVLVRAVKGASGPLRELPGLVLNGPAGKPTAEAEAILREGRTLPLADF